MTYMTPGVYVEEISAGPRPIQAVGTSTAGFVGVAPKVGAHPGEAWAVNNWTEFVREFVEEGSPSSQLAHAVFGFFQNGGSRCYIVNIGTDQSIAGGGTSRRGLQLLEEVDDVAIVAAPGYTDIASYESLLSHCEKLKDRVAILDAPESVKSIDSLTKVATSTSSSKSSRKDKEGGTPGGGEGSAAAPSAAESSGLRPRTSDGGFGSLYFPWITARDVLSPEKLVSVPPSGHIAGIYARSDSSRGVHKAPANEIVRGALGVTYRVTHEEQGVLNQQGVNCIRFFTRDGVRVWGARTLADSSSEWRYINVRRLFNMIEESIAQSTRWVVFEPNDRSLWKAIKRDVGAFLTMVWRDGALMGKTPEEAFFVKCDEETNTSEVIDSGQLVILIGVAPVKPAEFVIFRISQSAGGADVQGQ
jgi:hypothetical protein